MGRPAITLDSFFEETKMMMTFEQYQQTRERVTRESNPTVYLECHQQNCCDGSMADSQAADEDIVAYHVYRGGHYISEEKDNLLCLVVEDSSSAGGLEHLEILERELYDWVASNHPARVNWLCGCGNGALGITEEEIPANCPICGQEFPIPGTKENK